MKADPSNRSDAVSTGRSRSFGRVFAALGATALLLGVAVLVSGSAEAEGPGESRSAAPSHSSSVGSSSRKTGGSGPTGSAQAEAEAEPAPRRFDATTCWRELERFNESVTIDTFREWATPLLAVKDSLVRDYLKERLTELIGNDPGRASQVLGWARDASPREFGIFMMAVRDSEAVHQPQVASKMMELGLDDTLPPDRRAGILSALDTQKRFEPAMLNKLTNFAKEPTSGEAGWAAARTIARVMKRDFKQSGNLTPYLDKLLTIGVESPDEQIRYLGQMMPMHVAPLLDAEATDRYAKILATEGNEDGRDAAAHNLSLSQDKEKVLALFARTFETDPAVCVRWAVFRFASRVAGKDALPLMANMAIQDPRFQPVYRDFERLYASGVLDWMRIWNGLSDQDPFGCLDRHH
ncbi:hypothetical protein [Hyalangium gracile]|uniref:hypothetical protein n=1 Tax=Hyalangium gracile TaxID=394092 RepID=UPI001CCC4D7C|nr:hypothetical protein [Hyalangium gracile]